MPTGTARRPRTSPLGAVAVAVLAAVLLLGTWTTSAQASEGCDTVLVRVERSPSNAAERCTDGLPSNGLDALERAGFDWAPVEGQPGFVCTIDGYPDPCNGAPADAYWSYWHAAPGDAGWTYSSRGGASRKPPPGSADAWVFGDGSRPPSTPPPPAPAPSPSPPPTAPPAADGGTSGGDSSGGGSKPTGGAASVGSSNAGPSNGGSGGGSDTDTTQAGDPTPRPSTEPDLPADDTRDQRSGAEARDPASDDGPADDPPDARDTEDVEVDDASGPADGSAEDGARDDAATVAAGDEVTVPAGGRSPTGAAIGGLLVAGLAGAGLLRARRRGDDLDTT